MTDTGQIRRPGNPYGPRAGSMAVLLPTGVATGRTGAPGDLRGRRCRE